MQFRIVSLFLVICLLSPIIAYAQDSGSPVGGFDNYANEPIDESKYKLGPGDQIELNIIVRDNALSLNQNFLIGFDGKIFFPGIGEIKLAALSISEAKKFVDSRIKAIYNEPYLLSFRLSSPRQTQLYLTGSESRPFYVGDRKFIYVYGEVIKSGRYEFLPGKKFSDYISYAGGPTLRANLSAATITRQHKKYSVDGSNVIFDGNSSRDLEVSAGDVIFVPGKWLYFTDIGSFSQTIFSIWALYSFFRQFI